MKHCHEICRFGRKLYLASTGFDAILAFDLDELRFDWGMYMVEDESGFSGRPFDPQSILGPPPANALHLNNVWCDERGMFVSGLRTLGLLHFNGQRVKRLVTLPQGIHNARPWRDGVLFNDTEADHVRFLTPTQNRVFQVPHYPREVLEHTECEDAEIARQGFARGLCVLDDGRFAAGSSPSTVTLHDVDSMETLLSINLSTDIRNAIHGLEVWPFGTDQLPADLRPE